jgi:hypothetical protein
MQGDMLLAADVAGLLAIADPPFIFHWFCLVFPHTWFQFHQLHVSPIPLSRIVSCSACAR